MGIVDIDDRMNFLNQEAGNRGDVTCRMCYRLTPRHLAYHSVELFVSECKGS